MLPTLSLFSRALSTPDLSFRTLKTACVRKDSSQRPLLRRTTHFAEATIHFEGEDWLLFMPLAKDVIPKVERTCTLTRRLQSEAMTPIKILPQEMIWMDFKGENLASDLLLQHLPQGLCFEEALRQQSGETLYHALNDLERELSRIGVTHRNLKPSNLWWSKGHWVVLRHYDAMVRPLTQSVSYLSVKDREQGDKQAFIHLKRYICEKTGYSPSFSHAAKERTGILSDQTIPYCSSSRLKGHLWVGNEFEGLIVVQDPSGYGYVNAQNETVIPSTFEWAGDFHEGRAEVQTAEGMGLIHESGQYILRPIYSIVEYHPEESLVEVAKDGCWAVFDILGNQLTPFTSRLPQEEPKEENKRKKKGDIRKK